MAQIAWRAIKSRKAYLDVKGVIQYIQQSMVTEIGPMAVTTLRSLVPHWKKPPEFEVSSKVTTKGVGVYVEPVGPMAKYWTWSSKGVPGRFLRPRNKKAMAFRARYAQSAKSAHRSTAFSKGHWWPGIRARHYEKIGKARLRPEFQKRAENIMRRAVRAAKTGAK